MIEQRIEIAGRECLLFSSAGAPHGKTLLVNGDECLANLFREHHIAPPSGGTIAMILSRNRLDEYTPWPAKALRGDFPDFAGQADDYLAWMESDFFPVLQNEYGLLMDATHMGLMGQSLGGLLTLYAQTTLLGVRFGNVVCISPSTWYPGFLPYFLSHAQLLPPKYWFFACGQNEGRGHNDIKQNVAKYNAELIRHLAQLHGTMRVSTHWDDGSHHQYLPERCRWATSEFFKERSI